MCNIILLQSLNSILKIFAIFCRFAKSKTVKVYLFKLAEIKLQAHEKGTSAADKGNRVKTIFPGPLL